MNEQVERGTDSISTSISLDTVQRLAAATDASEVDRCVIDIIETRIDADAVEIAERNDHLLVPVARNEAGGTGREHATTLDTSLPGSALSRDEACVVDDLDDVRSEAAAASRNRDRGYRSLVSSPIGSDRVITAYARTPERFEEEDRELLTRVATIGADVIDRLDGTDELATEPLLDEIGTLVSHDLRNKINIATGRLDLAIKTDEEDHLDRSVEALERVERIADVVVSLTRTGKPIDELEAVSLETAVEDAFGPLDDSDATLTIKANATILADSGCLAQLLENLMRNAIEHSQGAITIEIGLLEDGFYVSDDGPGIPGEARDQVRELGYSTASDHDGKGLAIVSRMAEAHGWSVGITESTSGGARIEVHDVVFR